VKLAFTQQNNTQMKNKVYLSKVGLYFQSFSTKTVMLC